VEVDLQANRCTVTPQRDRVPDLAGIAEAVRASGYRPGRMWIAARGDLAQRDGVAWFTIAGTAVRLRVHGTPGAGPLTGRVELGAEPSLFVEPPPSR
jgi:hypothetical protein